VELPLAPLTTLPGEVRFLLKQLTPYFELYASPINLDPFRTLPSVDVEGAADRGRLTNLTRLTVDTSWYARYRSPDNPDFGAAFPSRPQPRREDRGLVDDEEVTRPEVVADLREACVEPRARRAIDDQEPACVASRGGPLRDPLPRELVVEVVHPHAAEKLSAPEDVQQDADDERQNQAGGERDVERAAPALDQEIPWKAAEERDARADEKESPDDHQHDPEEDQYSPELAHAGSPSASRSISRTRSTQTTRSWLPSSSSRQHAT